LPGASPFARALHQALATNANALIGHPTKIALLRFLLLLLLLSFLDKGKLGFLLFFPLPFVLLSLVAHVRFSLFEARVPAVLTGRLSSLILILLQPSATGQPGHRE